MAFVLYVLTFSPSLFYKKKLESRPWINMGFLGDNYFAIFSSLWLSDSYSLPQHLSFQFIGLLCGGVE